MQPAETETPAYVAPQVEHLLDDLGGVRANLENLGNSPLFKSDATFCTKNPLPMGSQTMFESVNNTGLFISNVDGKPKILQSANTGDFRRNATFERRPATNTNRPDGTAIDPG
jgi:hypothetical protein